MAFTLLFLCVSFLAIVYFQLCYAGIDDVVPTTPLKISQNTNLTLENFELGLPALYVFGDSYVDAGNNNFLPTKARANYFPYGIDFAAIPTGRATNGRMVVDFIAQAAGLPFPPPMLGMSETERKKTLTGVNYASGGSGILNTPPMAKTLLGHVLSFEEQVALFKNTTMDLKDQFDSAESFAIYLSKSLFFFHIAGNDLSLFLESEKRFTDIDKFAHLLSRELSKQLQALYQLGARKFFVNNVFPLGCQPVNINTKKPKTPCVQETNVHISTYNKLLQGLLADMEPSLPGFKFVLGDLFKLFEDVFASPSSYGFMNIKDSCCIDVNRNGTGPCAPNLAPCFDRKTHLFFDSFHITERMHFLWARTSLELLHLMG
ncbi:hypothetical protein CRYUN_Cryun23aG0027200 [Craigia yunnanensis]